MQNITKKVGPEHEFDFGGGRYSNATSELACDIYRLTEHDAGTCVTIAKAAAADFGAFQGQAGMKVGKANKDGMVTLQDMGSKVKGVRLTNALCVLRAVSLLNTLEHLETPLPKFTFHKTIEEWIASLKPSLTTEEEQKQRQNKPQGANAPAPSPSN